MLSTADADVIAAARRVLREQHAILEGTYTRRQANDDPLALYSAGKATEACVAAEYALFTALNVLSTYAKDDEAKRVLHT
jgi:hypothetical protein